MTSYGGGGGYSRNNYGAQGGDDAGGFMGGSQTGSQGGGAAPKNYSDDSLRPITLKQLVDCKEAYPGSELKIDNAPVTQVTVVGQVRAVNPQTTNITYKLDDGTAVMDVKKWVDAEKADDSDPKFGPDAYVRVWGRLTSFNGKKHIGAHNIRAIEDFNEVNYHMLEATYVHLCLLKGMPNGPGSGGGDQGGGAGGGGGGGDSMFADGGNGSSEAAGGGHTARLATVSRNGRTMFNFLHNSPGGNEGLHLNLVAQGTGLSVRDVIGAADELLGNGLVYTTVDDETWAILDY
ncbi:hypothetical protein B0T26DRAFT_800986 [Lasiosphaeria miniovina]|uniref:Replication factor A protein 2 n=1 Tax=Lasiosphaeria miniovina TaxID=1954250 RepID=A0AA40AUC6_9PEZI|nr:uncharacterized protein B0T26DRAFT_800986 [Lasiosphaeria miniovina]KAK0722176.1 hypothetical protein B0T26DRAFT_800986 [Lasiosphaeria miniovina]